MAPCQQISASHTGASNAKKDISPYCRLSNLLPVLSLFISKPLLPCLVPEKKTYSQYCFCYWDTSLEGCLGKEKGEMKGKKKKTCKIPEHTQNSKTYIKAVTARSLVTIKPSSKWKKRLKWHVNWELRRSAHYTQSRQ